MMMSSNKGNPPVKGLPLFRMIFLDVLTLLLFTTILRKQA